ncbi:MAG: substrate-binding domain-containing protein [Succinivibrionaceae bacterium]|nr:substrate-binding domain-containing protein [Succinivibrionaceae bacterium]
MLRPTLAALAMFLSLPALAEVSILIHHADPYTLGLADAVTRYLGKYGHGAVTLDAGDSPREQLRQAQEAVAQGAEALLVSLANPSDADDLEDIAAAGSVPLAFFLHRPATGSGATYYVGNDNSGTGKMAGLALARIMDGHRKLGLHHDQEIGLLLLQGGEGDPEVQPRSERAIEVLAWSGYKARVLGAPFLDWDRAQARKYVESFMRGGNAGRLGAIIAHNDQMALGALEALSGLSINLGPLGKGRHIPIVGMDGIPEAIAAVRAGRLDATIALHTSRLARVSATLVALLLDGLQVTPERLRAPLEGNTVLVPYTEINPQALKAKEGKHGQDS